MEQARGRNLLVVGRGVEVDEELVRDRSPDMVDSADDGIGVSLGKPALYERESVNETPDDPHIQELGSLYDPDRDDGMIGGGGGGGVVVVVAAAAARGKVDGHEIVGDIGGVVGTSLLVAVDKLGYRTTVGSMDRDTPDEDDDIQWAAKEVDPRYSYIVVPKKPCQLSVGG